MLNKKFFMAEYYQECINAQLSIACDLMDTKNHNQNKKNIAKKIPLFNDFLKFKFQDDIQARIL